MQELRRCDALSRDRLRLVCIGGAGWAFGTGAADAFDRAAHSQKKQTQGLDLVR